MLHITHVVYQYGGTIFHMYLDFINWALIRSLAKPENKNYIFERRMCKRARHYDSKMILDMYTLTTIKSI